MKEGIHPTYYPNAAMTCACGNTFTTGSTVESIHVEICAACHPFYTGKQKLVDTARRVEKYKTRTEKKSAESQKRLGKKVKRARATAKKAEKTAEEKKEEAQESK